MDELEIIRKRLREFFKPEVTDEQIENYMYHTHLPKWGKTLEELAKEGRAQEYIDYLDHMWDVTG